MSLSGEINMKSMTKYPILKKYCKKFVKPARKRKRHIELIEKMRPGDSF